MIKYGLHYGKIVKTAILSQYESLEAARKKVSSVGSHGFKKKVIKPHYGTVYDLIEASLGLEQDLISPIIELYNKHGIKVEALPNSNLIKELNDQIESQQKTIRMYEKIYNNLKIDPLDNKSPIE